MLHAPGGRLGQPGGGKQSAIGQTQNAVLPRPFGPGVGRPFANWYTLVV